MNRLLKIGFFIEDSYKWTIAKLKRFLTVSGLLLLIGLLLIVITVTLVFNDNNNFHRTSMYDRSGYTFGHHDHRL